MIDSLDSIPEDDALFNEFLILNGFKLVATEKIDDIPPDKNVLILYSKSIGLFRKLKRWAYRTNSAILYNPVDPDYDVLRNVIAVVADKGLRAINSPPMNLSYRLIPAELDIDLIESILDDLIKK